jgi:hypothetical protein
MPSKKVNAAYPACLICGAEKKTARARDTKHCRKCSKLEFIQNKYKDLDVVFVTHKAGDKPPQKVAKFRDNCKTCGCDRGYVFKSSLNVDCLSCASKKSYHGDREVSHNFYAIRDQVRTPNQGIVYTRSSYETFYLKYLNSQKINYFYEPKRFILSNGTSYLPDVYLPDENRFIELKGFDRKEDKEKFKLFQTENPETPITKLTKKDLVALGYSEKLYTDYRYLRMNSEVWKLIVLSIDEYTKIIGDDSVAITNFEDNEIIFRIDSIDLRTIMHEITHVYYSYTNTGIAGLNETQREEVIAEFFSHNYAKMMLSTIVAQELIQDICNAKYDLDIKVNILDAGLSSEQCEKLKRGFRVAAFRYDSIQNFMEAVKDKKTNQKAVKK